MNKNVWTLSEIARILQQPQHRLIYLCEKGVITPDFSDAQGRGSSRKFSARNIFEFSIVLVLSEFHFPATVSANFLYAVRAIENQIKANGLENFSLPNSLLDSKSPEITAIITEGSVLNLSVGFPGQPNIVFGGVDMSSDNNHDKAKFAKLEPNTETKSTEEPNSSSGGSNIAKFEINLTKIAQNLDLE